jgi:pimeloyl-ACP methyl ester carboxylesterase
MGRDHTPVRLVLVPQITNLEWTIMPMLEDWAEVAAYDAPGVGDEPPSDLPLSEAVAERGLDELDRRGWGRAVIVADEFGAAAAAHLAAARPGAVEAFVLGHARLSNSDDGEQAPINREVLAAVTQLAQHDRRTLVRQVFKMTQGAESRGGYTEALVDSYLERVPGDMIASFYATRLDAGNEIEMALRELDAPMLLVEHRGCLLFSPEGYRDAVGQFPSAQTASLDEKPSTSPAFAELLRAFCEQHVGARDLA